MDFSEEYRQKLVSADEAVKVIKSGDWVDYGWCTNTVDALDKALAKRTDELKDINLRGGILLKPLAVFEREDAGEHFTWNSWHMSGIERHMIARGCAFYSPIRYSELPRYYRELDCPDDVAMFQVAPMDKHGYFNFGPSASHLGAMCETARHIIVEVNENMLPWRNRKRYTYFQSQCNRRRLQSSNRRTRCRRSCYRSRPESCTADRRPDSKRCLLAAWYRWYAKRSRFPDRTVRLKGSWCSHRNVCRCIRRHCQSRKDYRCLQKH